MHSRQHASGYVFLQVGDIPESEWPGRLPIDRELGAWIVERVEDELRVGFWIKSAVDEPARAERAWGQHSQTLRAIKQIQRDSRATLDSRKQTAQRGDDMATIRRHSS